MDINTTIIDNQNALETAVCSLNTQSNVIYIKEEINDLNYNKKEKEDFEYHEKLPPSLNENSDMEMFKEPFLSEKKCINEHKINTFDFLQLEYGNNSKIDKTLCIKRTFTCEYCNKGFSSRGSFRSHIRTHFEGKSYTCEYCRESFLYESQLNQHLLKHSDVKAFTCDHCNASFAHKFNLKRHMLTHTSVRPFICEHCNKSFTLKSYLKDHLRVHSGNKPFACSYCNYRFTRRSFLKAHLRTHSSKIEKIVQKNCTDRKEEMNNLKYIKKEHSEVSEKLSSSVDENPVTDKLQEHLYFKEKEEPDKPKISTFDYLKLEYENDNSLSDTNIQPEFDTPEVKKEILFIHDEPIPGPSHSQSKSEVLGKETKHSAEISSGNASDLSKHLQTTSDLEAFICEHCDKIFKHRSKLKTHLLVHSGVKAFTCDQCHKSFTKNSCLKKHLLLHAGVKAFSCEHCNKSFTQKAHLKIHLVIHSGERPFSCDMCDKNFARKSDMKKHLLQVHSGVKEFNCDHCSKNFARNYDLKKHLLTHLWEDS